MKKVALIAFYGNLARLLDAGLPPADALRVLSREAPDADSATVCAELATRAKEGEPLSVALPAAAPTLPPSHRPLLQVGEAGGDLGAVLHRLSVFLERDRRALGRAITAGIYPGVIMILLFALSLSFALWVLPALAGLAVVLDPETAGQIRTHGRVLLVTAVALAVGSCLFAVLAVAWRRGARVPTRFGEQLDYALMRVPLVGGLIATRRLSRLFFALELLLARGTPAEEAFSVAGESVEGAAWALECRRIETRLREGERLADIVSGSPLVPRVAVARLSIAEAGVSLSGIARDLREYFEGELDQRLEAVTAAVEPALIALAGAAFALFVTIGVLPLLSSYAGLVS